jgi:DNA-binding NtrC family response regulator
VLQVRVGTTMAEVEEAFVRMTLKHTNNNKRKSAQLLGVCLRTLHNKLRTWEKGAGRALAAAAGRDYPPIE